MTSPILIPDTGILIARAFGEQVDPQARAATEALASAEGLKTRVFVPPSVVQETYRVLDEIDQVFVTLQEAAHTVTSSNPTPAGFTGAEEILLAVRGKATSPQSRFLGLIETEVSRLLIDAPKRPLIEVFAEVVGTAFLWKEAVRFGSMPGSFEYPTTPKPDPTPLDPPIPEVKGMDLAHVRAAQHLGELNGCPAILLVLERPLHRRKSDIQARFSHVLVTTPAYLRGYLG